MNWRNGYDIKEKYVSVFIWAPGCCFKTDLKTR